MLGAAGVGWWMAAAPRNLADLAQALPVLGVVTIYVLLALRGSGPVQCLAAGVLWAGLALAGLPGPAVLLALVLLGASLGTVMAPSRGGLAALPFAGALAALATLPVLARSTTLDWAVAVLPLLVFLPLGTGLACLRGARRIRARGQG